MIPPDWKELQPLLDAVLDAPLARRAAVMRELSGGDERRHARLAHLVAECERDAPLLERPAAERFASLFDDDVDLPLPEMLGGSYRIEREIGRGGMARVYLAQDVKHGRQVAVKVIRPDLAASLGRERFLREISIAARLRHPNIVPLYDSGDADGVLYFVMPFEEGPSLRARLSAGLSMTNPERVGILRDVARALAHAHEQGIAHRDVKPDNVMLSGGAAVVTDFGISKAISVAQGGTTPRTLTQGGAGIGTPEYMAPEQAVGDPSTDHRADIYSFGCLAYEMFAGTPPFHGMPNHELIAAHVGTRPPAVSDACPDVPANVAALIAQCLEKNPAARPQSAQDLLAALEGDSTRPIIAARRIRLSRAVTRSLLAAGLMLLAGGAYVATKARPSALGASGDRTLAILPLVSATGDSLEQEIADGLSDEIAVALFKASDIRVVSRRGVRNYRGQRAIDPHKVGRELGARFLVMGSLHKENGRLVILVSLVDATDGAILWADRVDHVEAELALVRDDIARSVGDTLRRFVGGAVAPATVSTVAAYRPNPDAYSLYVLAQQAMNRRGPSLQAPVDMFRRAIEIDTMYAGAYSGLSLALALLPYFSPRSPHSVAAEASANARHALRLDSTLSQPHIALGLVHQHAYRWDSAGSEFRTAVDLDGRDVEARVQYGRYLLFRGRTSEALDQFLAASLQDPASALVSSWVSYAYYVGGAIESAIAASARAYQSDPTNVTTLGFGALIRLKAGQVREAHALAIRPQALNPLSLYVLSALGDTSTLADRIRQSISRPWRQQTIRAYVELGRKNADAALTALELATDAGENWQTLESTLDPIYDPIRASPRFHRLLTRVGLR